MVVEIIHDKHVLLEFLLKEAGLQIYLIGDLDEFFWHKTVWYGLRRDGILKSVALLYCESQPPTLLCFQKDEPEFVKELLASVKGLLPGRFYAHLGEGLVQMFGKSNILEHYGINLKLVLLKKLSPPGTSPVSRLTLADLSAIEQLYAMAYPGNWFNSRMLLSGKYFGYFVNDILVGVAGIHVYSAEYKVAALGNITTHPDFRNRGIGKILTQTLCYDLQKDVEVIGLNVRSDNSYAIQLYKSLGFEIAGTYEECLISNVS